MNVLSIVPYEILPAKSGGQKAIAFFNEFLSKREQLFCVTVKNNNPALGPYKVFNSLSNSRFRYINIFYFFLIKKMITENKISHLILEHPYYGWLALLLKYICKVTVIVHSHNIEAERFRTTGKWWWKILWYYERWIHRKTDFTFCITAQDRNYFNKYYKIPYERSSVITYGIPWNAIPSATEKAAARSKILQEHLLLPDTLLFLFNGSLHYGPNLDAVKNITGKINPLLVKKGIGYKIIICGKSLPVEMNELKEFAGANIIYAGFVEDINTYFKGVDVFINPVTGGGGIKTKLVEALGFNLNAVSTADGARGVEESICNGKLLLCDNDDWEGFSRAMLEAAELTQPVTHEFFDHFYSKNIAIKAAGIIDRLV